MSATYLQPDDAKMQELILYIARCSEGDGPFGITKLNKILFYTDYVAYMRFSKSVTGHEYQALQNGPAPRQMVPILEKMESDKSLFIREDDYCGHTQRRPLALRAPRLDRFSGEEIAIVDEVMKRFWGMRASKISDISHEFVGWQIMEKGETIPYSLSLIDYRPLTEQEQQWALELEDQARSLIGNGH